MRIRVTLCGLLCSAASAQGAAQLMQMQQQQMAQQQMMQQQQMDLINQQQLSQINDPGLAGYHLGASAPKLNQQAGTEAGTVVVSMEDRSRGASIFFTTDGWTPTAASERYMGPITLRRDVTLRAIALAPGGIRSYVTTLPIQVAAPGIDPDASGPIRVSQLYPGTRLPLVFSASVSSRGEKIGDRLPVVLAKDLYIGDKLAAREGDVVEVLVTHIDNSHVQGLPGVLSFSARSLRLQDGTEVPLLGVEAKEGADHTKKAGIASVIPLGGLVVHGGDATITAGSRFDAKVCLPSEQSARLRGSR